MSSINAVRNHATLLLLTVLSAYSVAIPLVAMLVAPERALASLVLLAANALLTFAVTRTWKNGAVVRPALAISLVAGPAVNLYVFAGHPWQIDMHMAFFAALGVSALLADWRAVLAGAAAITVHHLALNVFVASPVFPDGASLARVLVHGAIVVGESAALVWLCQTLVRVFGEADRGRALAEAKAAEVEELGRAELARQASELEEKQERERAELERKAAEQAERDRLEAERVREREAAERQAQEQLMAERQQNEERARALAEEERIRALSEMSEAFLAVVAAAKDGDLTQRIRTDFENPQVCALADGLNGLLDAVRDGVSSTANVLAAIASADLTVRTSVAGGGEFARLAKDANATAEQLSAIVRDLQHASRDLAGATTEIRTGANELALRATEQADVLDSTEKAIRSLGDELDAHTQTANDAHTAVARIRESTTLGSDAMQEASGAMRSIEESSKSVADILGTIESISFQTTLLSLNASVEAARAGEAGRGFAVVAEEIRVLASTTTDASAKIRELVDQSTKSVESGVSCIETARTRMDAISASVDDVLGSVAGIAKSCLDQASRLEDLRDTFSRLNDIGQSNAALAEETHAATTQTADLVASFDATTNRFRIASDQPSAQAGTAA